MGIVRIIYHISDGFLVFSTVFMTVSTLLWLAYFLSQIYSNYKSYKNLQLRLNDVEIPERIHSIKKTIQRDFLFILILISELLIPIITGVEVLLPQLYNRIDGITNNSTRINYNCTTFSSGSFFGLLSLFGSVEILIEALRHSALIIHIRMYKLVLEFFIMEYRHLSFRKAFYFNIFVTCVQLIFVMVLTSILETYVIGVTLSALFLIVNILSVTKTGKVLYLILKCYLQEIRLIHTFDAINEYRRVWKMIRKYKISIIIFTVLLYVIFVGLVVYTIGCVWVEWVFLVNCEKLNPYVVTFNISHVTKGDLLDISLFSRACQSISGGIYFLGIVGVSMALGWNSLYSWRKQYVPKPELRKRLI